MANWLTLLPFVGRTIETIANAKHDEKIQELKNQINILKKSKKMMQIELKDSQTLRDVLHTRLKSSRMECRMLRTQLLQARLSTQKISENPYKN
jgi:hypothetical protein